MCSRDGLNVSFFPENADLTDHKSRMSPGKYSQTSQGSIFDHGASFEAVSRLKVTRKFFKRKIIFLLDDRK